MIASMQASFFQPEKTVLYGYINPNVNVTNGRPHSRLHCTFCTFSRILSQIMTYERLVSIKKKLKLKLTMVLTAAQLFRNMVNLFVSIISAAFFLCQHHDYLQPVQAGTVNFKLLSSVLINHLPSKKTMLAAIIKNSTKHVMHK